MMSPMTSRRRTEEWTQWFAPADPAATTRSSQAGQGQRKTPLALLCVLALTAIFGIVFGPFAMHGVGAQESISLGMAHSAPGKAVTEPALSSQHTDSLAHINSLTHAYSSTHDSGSVDSVQCTNCVGDHSDLATMCVLALLLVLFFFSRPRSWVLWFTQRAPLALRASPDATGFFPLVDLHRLSISRT